MRVGYQRVVDLDDLLDSLRDLVPRTIVFDVEPLAASWDTDQASLIDGVARILDRITADAPGRACGRLRYQLAAAAADR